jgi:hypothetical protein
MNNFLSTAKVNRYELEKVRHDVRYSSPKSNFNRQDYVLITNYGPFFDVREMNQFGDIRQIESDKAYKYYLVSYINPENAQKAINSYNYSDKRIKMKLLTFWGGLPRPGYF